MVINVPNLKELNILGFIFWHSEKKIFYQKIFFKDAKNIKIIIDKMIYLKNISKKLRNNFFAKIKK